MDAEQTKSERKRTVVRAEEDASLPVSEVVPVEEMLFDELTLADVEFDVDFEEPALEPPTAPWKFLTTLSPALIVRERWNSVVATAPSIVLSSLRGN